MQFPEVCKAKIEIEDSVYQLSNFSVTTWKMSENISILNEIVGKISVYYTVKKPIADEIPFLKEECQLISEIGESIQSYMLHEKLKTVFRGNQTYPLSSRGS